jgi:hypothetical protein
MTRSPTVLYDYLRQDLTEGSEVDAIDDDAAKLYRKYGFAPLLDSPLHLFLPMATVEDQLG